MGPYFSKASLRSSSVQESETFPTNNLVGIVYYSENKSKIEGHEQSLTRKASNTDKMAAHAVARNVAHAQESHERTKFYEPRPATTEGLRWIQSFVDDKIVPFLSFSRHKMAAPLFLGFDLSTQQLKALAIDNDLNVVTEASVHFDNDFPEFKTQGGVHKHEDKLTVTAPTLLWVKALDLVLQRLKENGLEFESVACLSGTGQQHGSVYWKKGARETLRNLQSGKSLYEQLKVNLSLSL